ncbi:hypothetical protein ACFFGR_00320 [Arthrobacter liuii]|uniref:Uncharacterized protein n=1 Tax=Arthrobacter liuii TaxID=1476996 RepID=A0ABQ2ASX3_9MICC|nr:hypothetical protein [Arthrobacter liuii]GGH96883.1 hypothetical protein GCM10007170_25760 [Arthrobacter liuii]
MITMDSRETVPVDAKGPFLQGPAAATPGPGKAIASLVLALLAPLSLVITQSLAAFALLLTFPYNGPSKLPWVAPLVLWSLPMILGSISTGLAITVIRDAKQQGFAKGMATASLCVSGVVFVIGLLLSIGLMLMMH